MKNFIQHTPPHPGEILLELYFEPLGLTVTEASQKLAIPRPNLSMLINGKMGVSPLMATKLAKAFKTSPMYWMNLQANYDLWLVTQNELDKIDQVSELV
jgi:addiction module HigA family antidote